MRKRPIGLVVNGDRYEVAVEPWRSLAEVLREDLGLTGTENWMLLHGLRNPAR